MREAKYCDYVFCMPGSPSSGEQAITVQMAYFDMACGGKLVGQTQATGPYVYAVRNACLQGKRLVKGEWKRGLWKNQKPFENIYADYDRIIWIDSDCHVNTQMIQRLISHDIDIAAGWYRAQTRPLFSPENTTSCGFWPGFSDWTKVRNIKVGEMATWPTDERGLIEVDHAGMGCVVMKKGVMESIEFPWFKHWDIEWTDAEGEECCDQMTEDPGFYSRVKEKGFKVFVDPTVWVAHEKRIKI